jgi:hypothetical protein
MKNILKDLRNILCELARKIVIYLENPTTKTTEDIIMSQENSNISKDTVTEVSGSIIENSSMHQNDTITRHDDSSKFDRDAKRWPLPQETTPERPISAEAIMAPEHRDRSDNYETDEEVREEKGNHDATRDYSITAEIMMTSGPRKSDADHELGEDAAGVILTQDSSFFWIADGTSECPSIPINLPVHGRYAFSSRSLAQEIGLSFRQYVGDLHKDYEDEAMRTILEKSFFDVRDKWNQILGEFLQRTESQNDLAGYFGKDALNLDFSATFICGALSKNGVLSTARCGDSLLLIKQADGKITIPPIEPYRFFMRLNRKADGYDFTTSTDLKIMQDSPFPDVTMVVAGSDGIGQLPYFIKQQQTRFPFKEIRGHISRFIAKTYDDKICCILSRERY